MKIESVQNPRIKNLLRLITDNRFRRKSRVFVVEGKQENQRALQFGYKPVEFFINQEIFKDEWKLDRTVEVSRQVYEKIAYRATTEGVIGVFEEPLKILSDLNVAENASLIIVEGIEKPGNLGAILRSCEAFGVDALIVTDPKTDFFNTNVIRSSVGCLFGMNFYSAGNEETLQFLEKNSINVFTTFMHGPKDPMQNKDFTGKTALLFGTEHSGLSNFWVGKGENVQIPMAGTIDSLNLSNAVAIGCYEILRQKIKA